MRLLQLTKKNNERFVKLTSANLGRVLPVKKICWCETYRGIYPDEMLDNFDFDLHRKNSSPI